MTADVTKLVAATVERRFDLYRAVRVEAQIDARVAGETARDEEGEKTDEAKQPSGYHCQKPVRAEFRPYRTLMQPLA